MAFKLAEAFIELKARGEKELHKSLDQTKEKVKEVGPAADQTEKKIEKAAQDAAKQVDKSADKMVDSLQKPIDKLAELEREMKGKFDALHQRAEKLKADIRSDSGSAPLFGRFGGAGNVAAGAALVGIGAAVVRRGNELATGEDSAVLGREVSQTTREVVTGLKEVGTAFVEVAKGFIDGLLGLSALIINLATFGGAGALGRWVLGQRADEAQRAADRAAGNEFREQIGQIDADAPLRALARRQQLDALFRKGGIAGLEDEAARLKTDEFTDINAAMQLREVNARIAQEKERAAKAAEASAAATEREAEAAARAFREAMNAATLAPHRQLEILREAWQTGKPPEVIEAERRFGLSPQSSATMEARMRGIGLFQQAGRDAAGLDKFNNQVNSRLQALIDEGNEVAKLRREYEEFAATVAAMPEGAGKADALAKLAELRLNVDAAGALLTERAQERQRQQRQENFDRRAAGVAGAFAQDVMKEFDFLQGLQRRQTASFQVVDVADFARQLQADIFAKEDDEMRIEEEKRMHEDAQKKRDEIKGAVDKVADAVGKIVAVAG